MYVYLYIYIYIYIYTIYIIVYIYNIYKHISIYIYKLVANHKFSACDRGCLGGAVPLLVLWEGAEIITYTITSQTQQSHCHRTRVERPFPYRAISSSNPLLTDTIGTTSLHGQTTMRKGGATFLNVLHSGLHRAPTLF